MSLLRCIGIGDLHLTTGARNDDRLAALDYVIQFPVRRRLAGLDHHVDAWLWPGDLTHAGMTIEIRNQLVPRVQQMAEIAPVVIVPGNHDPDGDLDFLSRLRSDFPVHVITSPQVITIDLARRIETPLSIFCLPWPTKAGIVAAGTPFSEVHQHAVDALDVIFMQAASELAACAERDHLIGGVIGHITVAGAVASTGQPQIGTQMEITDAHLNRLPKGCFCMFNHIHRHQSVGSVAFYPGSLCRMDWGETEPKGFVTLECHDVLKSNVWAFKFEPVPVPPMYHVEGLLTRDNFEWRVTKGPNGARDVAPDSWVDCDVRVRASYHASERDALADAKARVRHIFRDARRFEFEPVAIPDRALRAPEVAQASTLDDKLRAYAKVTGVAWSDHIVAMAAELQATDDGDAVVARVDARLRAVIAETPAADTTAETEPDAAPPVPSTRMDTLF